MVFCYYCGGSGHYKNECPTYRMGRFAFWFAHVDNHLCLCCGGAGHVASVCPSVDTRRYQSYPRGSAYSSSYGSTNNSSFQEDRPS